MNKIIRGFRILTLLTVAALLGMRMFHGAWMKETAPVLLVLVTLYSLIATVNVLIKLRALRRADATALSPLRDPAPPARS